jgi:glyoxylase-like metal-dependent hydrolase (beta-lactamase superfamily II)
MRIACLTVGLLACNCYLVADEATGEAVIIDPGGGARGILSRCERLSIRPTCVVCTHAHADHIAAVPALKRMRPELKLCVGRGDAPMLADRTLNLSAMFGGAARMPAPDVLLDEGARIPLGDRVLSVLETPGHTPGGVSLVAEGEEPLVVFCGDLVFRGGVGRTDMPGGSFETLRRSIERKIFVLPDPTVLLPGHGDSTTVGEEKRAGFLLGDDA